MRSATRIAVQSAQGAVIAVFNTHSLLVAGVACVSVLITSSAQLDIQLDTYLRALLLGAVWPIVNTIKMSYTRREKALKALASLKASCFGIYLCWRDFSARQDALPLCRRKLLGFMYSAKHFLKETDGLKRLDHLADVYRFANDISLLNYEMGKSADGKQLPPVAGGFHEASRTGPLGAGIISRNNQYIRFLVRDFELMRMFRDYRTPQGLRYMSSLLLHFVVVLLGPFYNTTCSADRKQHGCLTAYFMCMIFATVVFLLYHVQQDLENSYDGEGLDDVRLELTEKELITLTFNTPPGMEHTLSSNKVRR